MQESTNKQCVLEIRTRDLLQPMLFSLAMLALKLFAIRVAKFAHGVDWDLSSSSDADTESLPLIRVRVYVQVANSAKLCGPFELCWPESRCFLEDEISTLKKLANQGQVKRVFDIRILPGAILGTLNLMHCAEDRHASSHRPPWCKILSPTSTVFQS